MTNPYHEQNQTRTDFLIRLFEQYGNSKDTIDLTRISYPIRREMAREWRKINARRYDEVMEWINPQEWCEAATALDYNADNDPYRRLGQQACEMDMMKFFDYLKEDILDIIEWRENVYADEMRGEA